MGLGTDTLNIFILSAFLAVRGTLFLNLLNRGREMSNVVSDIVRYRARSVVSRYLHQRGEPTAMLSSGNSDGVQVAPSGNLSGTDASPASTQSISSAHIDSASHSSAPTIDIESAQSPVGVSEGVLRVRFPPLADDYDIYGLDVADLLDYLSELSFTRELKLVTARCYRRWLAAYLEDVAHPDASRIRHWVIPHSPEYYDMLLMATERIDNEKEVAATIEKVKSKEMQLDMFSEAPAPSSVTENDLGIEVDALTNEEHFSKDAIMQMMFESQQIKESAPIAEYDYVSSDVTDIFIAALTSKKASGGFKYKHGELAAALFTGTIMLGLRPREWQHATYHETYTDPQSLLTLGPVVEVFTLKQERRRDDNPLREKRLIVLDQFRPNECALIQGLLAIVHSHDSNIDKMLNDVRMTLSNVWKRLIKEGKVKQTRQIKKQGRATGHVGSTEISEGYGVNLYTARHVFAEEVKRSGAYTRFELAAMIGHTTTINQRYYTLGNKYKLKTYSHTLPRPWPGDALDIEQWCDDVVRQLSSADIERLRSEGVFYPESGNHKEFERSDSIEEFVNR